MSVLLSDGASQSDTYICHLSVPPVSADVLKMCAHLQYACGSMHVYDWDWEDVKYVCLLFVYVFGFVFV